MTTILALNNVSKQYGNSTKALNGISFSVNKGEFVGVIGPSGAGKSTLLRSINRMIEPTSGEIIFDGISTRSLSKKDMRKLRTNIGMVFQHYNLVDRLTVLENVLHGRLGHKSTLSGVLGLYKEEEKKQAIYILDLLGLADQKYKRCDQLSGGQKQRVGIARALIQNPKVLLCDEPIASLDPNSSKVIMDYLKEVSIKFGITCLVNLHQVEVALKYSDRIIGINKGRKVFDGKPEEVTDKVVQMIYGTEAKDLILT